jgi:hypothetical protein
MREIEGRESVVIVVVIVVVVSSDGTFIFDSTFKRVSSE